MGSDRLQTDVSARPAREGPPRGGGAGGAPAPALSALDARVLRAVEPMRERTAARVAELVGCHADVAASSLRRLRGRMLVEPDGRRPTGWLRTRHGDLALEHQP
jgi:hypothetical protein